MMERSGVVLLACVFGTFSDTRTQTPSFALCALGKEFHPLAGMRNTMQGQHRN